MLKLDDNIPAYHCAQLEASSPFVLLCEHASARIPKSLGDLGLPEAERLRHIGWDIGALGVAEWLSSLLDASLHHHNYSRLVIDCNRPLHAASLIPEVSEDTKIPGNQDLSLADRNARIEQLWRPYQAAIGQHLKHRQQRQQPSLLIAVHSFTPVYHGVSRPWEIGLLSRDTRLSQPLGLALTRQNPRLVLGLNQPYQVSSHTDYTLPAHGEARDLPHVTVEFRHDLIDTPETQKAWAIVLAKALMHCLPELL